MSQIKALRWVRRRLPDLSGRTCIITGASSGIGAEAARLLAARGANIVLAVRAPRKVEALVRDLGARAEVRSLDLASFASIRAFAEAWTGPIDVLINNAGVMNDAFLKTEDGLEQNFAVNHLAPFLLTGLLREQIRGRVVAVSSHAHRVGTPDWDKANSAEAFEGMSAYARSKLANLLFTRELSKRFVRSGSAARAMAAHPGLTKSNLLAAEAATRKFRITKKIQNALGQSSAMGALPIVYAACADILSGSYVGPSGFYELHGYPRLVEPRQHAKDDRAASELWALSERLTELRWS